MYTKINSIHLDGFHFNTCILRLLKHSVIVVSDVYKDKFNIHVNVLQTFINYIVIIYVVFPELLLHCG